MDVLHETKEHLSSLMVSGGVVSYRYLSTSVVQRLSDMDDFSRLFEVSVPFRVLICVKCQFAVVVSQIDKVFRAHHSRVGIAQRREIIAKVNDLSGLARVHLDVIYPLATHPTITLLPVYFDGLKCSSEDE